MAGRGGKNVRGDIATLESIFSIGVGSSNTQIDRPCVARTRSFSRAWISMSPTGTDGKFILRAVQFAPPTLDTHNPNPLPADSRCAFRVYSGSRGTVPGDTGIPVRM